MLVVQLYFLMSDDFKGRLWPNQKKKLQQPNLDEYSETKICSAIRLEANLGTTSSRANMKSQFRQ